MIHFFGNAKHSVYAVYMTAKLSKATIEKLSWLFGNNPKIEQASIDAFFVGPRASMVTPWSTNAVEITQNMGIKGIVRIILLCRRDYLFCSILYLFFIGIKIFRNLRNQIIMRKGNLFSKFISKDISHL